MLQLFICNLDCNCVIFSLGGGVVMRLRICRMDSVISTLLTKCLVKAVLLLSDNVLDAGRI